jgi:excisionase family DNA binding protein
MHFLTLEEVADILRVQPEAVRRAAKCKKLRGTKPGKEWLFAPADIITYVDRGYNRPEPSDE